MSGGEIRKISPEGRQMVQNLIEQCLPHYMTQKQVVDVIYQQQKIEPSFTYQVWQQLEEENEEFFKGYYLRLMLTEQIAEFNTLLDRQATLMHHVSLTGPRPGPGFRPVFDGPLPHDAARYVPENPAVVLKTENVRWPVTADLAGGMPAVRSGVPPDMLLARHANGGGMMTTQGGTNGVPIKTEAGGYLGDSRFVLAADGRHVVEAHGDASLSPFSSIESNSHLLNGSLVDDSSSFGAFGPMPSSYDMLESFPTPGFLPSDRDNFMDSHGSTVDHQGETNGLDAISKILRYEDFGSNS